MRFLVDSMLPPSTAQLLREFGHDAITPVDIGGHSLPDSTLTDFAVRDDRVIVTENALDFAAAPCTVILVRKRWWQAAWLAARLARALDRFAAENPSPGPWAHWLEERLR